MILIIYAHPYPQHSHANKRMLKQVETLDGVEIRSLYQLYPDFTIDIAAEQQALERADAVVQRSAPSQVMDRQSVVARLGIWSRCLRVARQNPDVGGDHRRRGEPF